MHPLSCHVHVVWSLTCHVHVVWAPLMSCTCRVSPSHVMYMSCAPLSSHVHVVWAPLMSRTCRVSQLYPLSCYVHVVWAPLMSCTCRVSQLSNFSFISTIIVIIIFISTNVYIFNAVFSKVLKHSSLQNSKCTYFSQELFVFFFFTIFCCWNQ